MCDGAHPGPCRYLTTQFFRRLNLPSGGDLVVSGQPFTGQYTFADTTVPLGRLPGVYLLGDYFVGASHDIGMRLASHRHVLEQGRGDEFNAFTGFLDRKGNMLPRISILSLNALDVNYCSTELSNLGYPLVNERGQSPGKPECVAEENPLLRERLQSLLEEINRRQDFSVHST